MIWGEALICRTSESQPRRLVKKWEYKLYACVAGPHVAEQGPQDQVDQVQERAGEEQVVQGEGVAAVGQE